MIIKKEIILSGDQNQLSEVLRTHFVSSAELAGGEITHEQRLAIASAIQNEHSLIIDWSADVLPVLTKHIEDKFSVNSALFKAELQFSLMILESYIQNVQLDKELSEQLYRLRTTLLAHAIADPQFWITTHPLKRLTDFLYQQMLGWQPNLDEQAGKLQSIFNDAIEEIIATPLLDNLAFQTLHKTLRDDFSTFNNFVEEEYKHLVQLETQNFSAGGSDDVVSDFLNRITKGKKLPTYIMHFISGKFLADLQALVVNKGAESNAWSQWQKLLEALVGYYQAGALPAGDMVKKAALLKLPKDIEKLMEQYGEESDEFDDFITEVSYDFSQIAAGKDIDGLTLVAPLEKKVLVDTSRIDLPKVDRLVTKALVNKAKEYQIGQWFLYKAESGVEIRCKYLLALGEQETLIFANYIGQKALTIALDDFAYLLSAKHINALLQSSPTDYAVSLVLDTLLENFASLQVAKLAGKKPEENAAAKESDLLAKKIAAEKAKTEALAISERKVNEDQTQVLAKIADEMKRHARLTLNSLALGSWVEVLDADTKEFKRIKLAVKYNATGRYVFVDADGQTVAEHMREDLIDMVLFKKLKLLESDTYFADRLSRIVKTIRKS